MIMQYDIYAQYYILETHNSIFLSLLKMNYIFHNI